MGRKCFCTLDFQLHYINYPTAEMCLNRQVDENCALLSHYAVSSGNVFGFLIPEDGTDRLSQNVGKKLPLLAA